MILMKKSKKRVRTAKQQIAKVASSQPVKPTIRSVTTTVLESMVSGGGVRMNNED